MAAGFAYVTTFKRRILLFLVTHSPLIIYIYSQRMPCSYPDNEANLQDRYSGNIDASWGHGAADKDVVHE